MSRKKDKDDVAERPKRRKGFAAPGPALIDKPGELLIEETSVAKRPRKRVGSGLDALLKKRSPHLRYFMGLEEEVERLREDAAHHRGLEEEVAALKTEIHRLQTWQSQGDNLESCPVCRNLRASDT